MGTERFKITRHGWFGFEGFGRPYEAWAHRGKFRGWRSLGRCFTRGGARRQAEQFLRSNPPDDSVMAGGIDQVQAGPRA